MKKCATALLLAASLAAVVPVANGGTAGVPDVGTGTKGIPKGGGEGGGDTMVPPVNPGRANEWWRRTVIVSMPVRGEQLARATLVRVEPTDNPGRIRCEFGSNTPGPWAHSGSRLRDGVVSFAFDGWLIPRGSVLSPGECRAVLQVSRQMPGGGWSPPVEVTTLVQVAPHVRVSVDATARMREWLKPHGNCIDDDRGNKLGFRTTANAAGGGCRTDLLTTRNRSRIDPANWNDLPEAVIIRSVTWRTEGDSKQCSVCSDVSSPCRGVPPPPIGYKELTLGPAARPGTETHGPLYGTFTGPPETPSRGQVRTTGSGTAQSGTAFATNEHGDWRTYVFTIYARMNCDPWAPPPSHVKAATEHKAESALTRLKNKVRTALGLNELPPPPPPPDAPSLRIVLDSWEFLRPGSTPLPWE